LNYSNEPVTIQESLYPYIMKISAEKLSQNEPTITINILRHGEAKYNQGKVAFDEANDLTDKGITDVQAHTKLLAQSIDPQEEVTIWTSPYGRTIQTAQLAAEVLQQHKINFRRNIPLRKIKIFDQLREIGIFWPTMKILLDGGEFKDASGKTIFIDKSLTNPENLQLRDFVTSDTTKKYTTEILTTLPAEILESNEKNESFQAATSRMIDILQHLKKIREEHQRIILVTHEALTAFLVNLHSETNTGVKPGEFIELKKKDKKLLLHRYMNEQNKHENDVVEDYSKKFS